MYFWKIKKKNHNGKHSYAVQKETHDKNVFNDVQ